MQFETMVCTKTVYNMIERGDFYRISNKNLPVKRNKKPRNYKKIHKIARNNKKGTSIELRPEEINQRLRFGDWEMDLVIGSGKACLLVMTERKTRLEIIFKIPDKSQASVIRCINILETKYGKDFPKIFKSITMDNGIEFLDQLGIETSVIVEGNKRTVCFYAHPYSSWERGSNENNNKLIRRFIPKGSNIDDVSEEQIQEIQDWMNNYPRKLHGYLSALEICENIA